MTTHSLSTDSSEVVIYPLKSKMLGGCVFILGYFAYLALSTLYPDAEWSLPLAIRILGYVMAPFFLKGLVTIASRLICNDDTPAIIINDQGVWDNAATYGSAGLIPWEEIEDVLIRRFHGADFVVISLWNRADLLARQTGWFKKMFMSSGLFLTGGQVLLPTAFLSIKPAELAERIQFFHAEYRSKSKIRNYIKLKRRRVQK